jgi:drug/metabolite transporter (DMT)-like permease
MASRNSTPSNGPARPARLVLLTALALLAFAGNSLLCRAALRDTALDAVSFTLLRLVSGALVLWACVQLLGRASAAPASLHAKPRRSGDWRGGAALFVYAAGFSLAYTTLPAGTGALLLFGAVQVTMIGAGLGRGERLSGPQWLGFIAACAGLAGLLWPGAAMPSFTGAVLMLTAGVAWGVYSLLGRHAGPPLVVTAGNFWRASAAAALLWALVGMAPLVGIGPLVGSGQMPWRWDSQGALLALLSGAVTSGLGYALWYSALPDLRATQAGVLQLTVPVITTAGAVAWLGEALSWQLVLCSAVVLGGVALVIRPQRP